MAFHLAQALNSDGLQRPGALVGIDVVAVDLLERWLARYSEEQLSLVFTSRELFEAERSGEAAVALSVSYSGKEAVSKALQTGFAGLAPPEIEVVPRVSGVAIALAGAARERALAMGVTDWVGCYWRFGRDVVTTVMTR